MNRTYDRVMRACILSRDFGWGRRRTADLQRDGYHVAEFRTPQKIILALAGQPVRPGTGWSLLPHALPGDPARRRHGRRRVGAVPHLPGLPALEPLLPGSAWHQGRLSRPCRGCWAPR